MNDLYGLKNEIKDANEQIEKLKICMFADCQLSSGNQVITKCINYQIGEHQSEVCIEI